MADDSGLRFVERWGIFIMTGILTYKLNKIVQISFLDYGPIGELAWMTLGFFIWAGMISLTKRILKKILEEKRREMWGWWRGG